MKTLTAPLRGESQETSTSIQKMPVERAADKIRSTNRSKLNALLLAGAVGGAILANSNDAHADRPDVVGVAFESIAKLDLPRPREDSHYQNDGLYLLDTAYVEGEIRDIFFKGQPNYVEAHISIGSKAEAPYGFLALMAGGGGTNGVNNPTGNTAQTVANSTGLLLGKLQAAAALGSIISFTFNSTVTGTPNNTQPIKVTDLFKIHINLLDDEQTGWMIDVGARNQNAFTGGSLGLGYQLAKGECGPTKRQWAARLTGEFSTITDLDYNPKHTDFYFRFTLDLRSVHQRCEGPIY